MTRDPVHIPIELRAFVLECVVEKLLSDGIRLLIASLDDHHLHRLAPFPDRAPRHWLGRAKKNASHLARASQLFPPGTLWAKRSKAKPITSRAHQIRAARYISSHIKKGAAVWYSPVLRAAPKTHR